jgi:glycerophosphoryl diester phosphodiesterase
MANPWLERRVLCYAHQGGAKESPSSTLLALRTALAAGATALELDVHATSDGELVVCHDPTLERTTNGAGPIAGHTLAEVRALDNAYWFVPGEDTVEGLPADHYPLRGRAPADRELGVATLDEVLEAFPGVFLNLDIKQTAPEVDPYEQQLAEKLVAAGRTDDVIVASFDDRATDAFRAHAPGIGTSPGFAGVAEMVRAVHGRERPPESLLRYVALQVPARFMDTVIVDERFVGVAHEEGLAVHVWTVDEAPEMERLLALGVDGIMSDFPSVLAGVLAERGAAWVA